MNSRNFVAVLLIGAVAAEGGGRKPKLFFVSTSSTTSTLTTGTTCYQTNPPGTGSIAACTGRKRRALMVDDLKPSGPTFELEKQDTVANGGREGRFFLYWITTTSRTISTSISGTTTISSVECTTPDMLIC